MNTMNTNPLRPDGMPNMDADLLALIAGLDRLVAIDRAAPSINLEGINLEDRLMHATLPALHGVQPVVTHLAELGAMDRAAASRDLEEGVFEASAPTLRSAQPVLVLRHSAEDARLPSAHARVARQPLWSNQFARLAAAVVLVSGAAIAVRSALVSPSPSRGHVDVASAKTDVIAERVKRDMDLLFAVIDTKPVTAPTTEPASDTDTDDLTNWLIEGTPS